MFEQLIDALARDTGNRNHLGRASPFDGGKTQFRKLGLDHVDIGPFAVDLVDRHDDGYAGRLGMFDGFFCLRHRAVICSHDEDHDIGDIGTSGPHAGEGAVSGSVHENNMGVSLIDPVGTHVLSDAAGFGFCNGTLADLVEQCRFSMVHMSHQSHNRCT